MTYPDLPNPDLLSRIPLSARVVLDVGCATGALGAEYKRRNPAARVIGIERDVAAARVASERLDAVYVADLDRDPVPFADSIPQNSVDCIIYGDVLEHLADPWQTLQRHVEFLREDGVLLLCMPNVEHWTFVERLLRGTWDYEPQGLLDQTHLRWFTVETTEALLRKVGLIPLDVTPRIFDEAACKAFLEAIAPSLNRLGIGVADYAKRAAPLQYVWRAQKCAVQPLPLISTMLSPVGGVSHLRVVEPMAALAGEPSVTARVVDPFDELPSPNEPPGIYIFHRPVLAGPEGLARIRQLVSLGWLLVCEFDDHPDYLTPLQRPEVYNFRGVHAIQTSTEALAAVLARDNSEIAVFPNVIARLPELANFRNLDRLSLLFAGLNRENEWPPFLEALNAVANKAGNRLQFTIVNDRKLFESLVTPHKQFVPLCSYQTYQSLLATSEISFMPLLDNSFNRCKSDLKFIEAAAHRVVSLATPVVYERTIQDGRTGILFRTPEELEQRLLRLVADPAMALAIGETARAYVVAERMLASQIPDRLRWYHSLWSRRDALNEALFARLPELRA